MSVFVLVFAFFICLHFVFHSLTVEVSIYIVFSGNCFLFNAVLPLKFNSI
jgi:cytochrome bd-type quinol oxidase subunit 1